jgi:hypothetical protein
MKKFLLLFSMLFSNFAHTAQARQLAKALELTRALQRAVPAQRQPAPAPLPKIQPKAVAPNLLEAKNNAPQNNRGLWGNVVQWFSGTPAAKQQPKNNAQPVGLTQEELEELELAAALAESLNMQDEAIENAAEMDQLRQNQEAKNRIAQRARERADRARIERARMEREGRDQEYTDLREQEAEWLQQAIEESLMAAQPARYEPQPAPLPKAAKLVAKAAKRKVFANTDECCICNRSLDELTDTPGQCCQTQCCQNILCRNDFDEMQRLAREYYRNFNNVAWRKAQEAKADFAGWPSEVLNGASCPLCKKYPFEIVVINQN